MKQYLKTLDPWSIIEDEFSQENQRKSESIFSLGNGHIGQRANFEEKYSGDSVYAGFAAGVYYPDPTKVGWWKNGYPEYFAKTVVLPNWSVIELNIGTTNEVDLATAKVLSFKRVLNMRDGCLERDCTVELKDGKQLRIIVKKFLSLVNKELGAIKYTVIPLNFSGNITFTISTDSDVKNESSYYGEHFFDIIDTHIEDNETYVTAFTARTFFQICIGTKFSVAQNDEALIQECDSFTSERYASSIIKVYCQKNVETTVYKYGAILSSLHHEPESLRSACAQVLQEASARGFDALLAEHVQAWHAKWDMCDIAIEGDVAAQQAIRFNMFQLYQTYTGDDPNLNIGPKGFTGEKYGGVTYWDTEAFCFSFYMCTANPEIAKNLLIYRYNHLEKAIENAEKLGFSKGAAFYPMVTINGEECHNEWEITFEEIHRNGAIAYAIYNYVNYTGDANYLVTHGLEVLIAISRFWSQRVNFSTAKNKYVILGVTGPNEYENNVNNNWYTNTMAAWTLNYTLSVIKQVKASAPEKYAALISKSAFAEKQEVEHWQDIIDKMYYPIDSEQGIFLQQDGYMDKEQMLAKDLNPAERPLNQHWSWDRILRSCFIKQADVMQGIYCFEEQFDKSSIKRNFDFYEPRTVHESSLSAAIHALLAAHIGYLDKAYELYLRATRLDLDDYNKEVEEGCHITSMGGSWLTVVQGFGGMRVVDGKLHLNPRLPKQWEKLTFKLLFRGKVLRIEATHTAVTVHNETAESATVIVGETVHEVKGKSAECCTIA